MSGNLEQLADRSRSEVLDGNESNAQAQNKGYEKIDEIIKELEAIWGPYGGPSQGPLEQQTLTAINRSLYLFDALQVCDHQKVFANGASGTAELYTRRLNSIVRFFSAGPGSMASNDAGDSVV